MCFIVKFITELGILFVFFFMWGLYRPTRDFFTHMETSPLLVKGCKFLPMLGTHGHEQSGFFSVTHRQ